ncbi:MAG: hypothetical protein LQ340_003517 [Diploschistes diacapsis]|nr:MAG: hypothetical protein LQ340_003517 [Diploschistes diacapsis]
MNMVDSVIQLKCNCNNYPWGKKGDKSAAARYCARTPGTDFKIDNDTEYAEMWMGDHPSTPSYALSTGKPLEEILKANGEALLGPTVLNKFGTNLPFLPKILSMAKALPLQLHPNKDLATELHKKDPSKFSDPNHKPEIAVALSTFEAFAGFKDFKTISSLFSLPPLREYAPSHPLTESSMKELCTKLLQLPENIVRSVQDSLAKVSREEFGDQAFILDLLPRIQDQYGPADNGTLVALLCMNFLVLQPGEAVYVPADGIHAWFAGDIVECMARSDNVLNVGFCPAADRDNIELFTDTLTFHAHRKEEMLLKPVKSAKGRDGKTVEYRPELSEFNMLVTKLGNGEKEEVPRIAGPSVMIVTEGQGKMRAEGKDVELKEGWIFFVGQGVETEYVAEHGGLQVYRAYAE